MEVIFYLSSGEKLVADFVRADLIEVFRRWKDVNDPILYLKKEGIFINMRLVEKMHYD